MVDRIKTYKLEDLLNIFDKSAQEDDAGDARIFYTFDQDEQPQRQRVGSTFILDVESPKCSFFVTAEVDEDITAGTISPTEEIEGASLDRYPLTPAGLSTLLQEASIAYGYDEEAIAALLEE